MSIGETFITSLLASHMATDAANDGRKVTAGLLFCLSLALCIIGVIRLFVS